MASTFEYKVGAFSLSLSGNQTTSARGVSQLCPRLDSQEQPVKKASERRPVRASEVHDTSVAASDKSFICRVQSFQSMDTVRSYSSGKRKADEGASLHPEGSTFLSASFSLETAKSGQSGGSSITSPRKAFRHSPQADASLASQQRRSLVLPATFPTGRRSSSLQLPATSGSLSLYDLHAPSWDRLLAVGDERPLPPPPSVRTVGGAPSALPSHQRAMATPQEEAELRRQRSVSRYMEKRSRRQPTVKDVAKQAQAQQKVRVNGRFARVGPVRGRCRLRWAS